MTTEPTAKHQEEARESDDELIASPQRVWLHVHADADCWCCYHFDEGDDPQHLTEYVHVDALSARNTQIREVLEGLRGCKGNGRCWCDPMFPNIEACHDPACLAARELWERVQGTREQ